MLTKMNPMALPAVERLRDLKSAWEGQTLAGAFKADADRFNRLHIELPGLLFDYSKQRVDNEVMNALVEWAQTAGVAEARDAQFSGESINATEGRAVLHMALRGEPGDDFKVGGVSVMPDVLAVRERMLRFAEAVRADAAITDVVNIGIGGSDLGPEMVVRALRLHPEMLRLVTHGP